MKRPAARCTESTAVSGPRPDRASRINQMTVKQLAAARARRGLRRGWASPASACGASRSQAYGVERDGASWSATPGWPSPASAGAASSPRSTRRSGPRRWTTTARPSTRRRPSAPTPWSWSPAASRRAAATCTAPASASPTRSAELAPYAADRGVRLAIEPLHPMFASDRCVVSTLAQALDLAERFPADAGRRRRRHLPHLVGRHGAARRSPARAPAAASPPSSSPTGSPRCPAGVLTGRGQLGDGSIDLREWKALRRGGRLHRPDRGRALQRRAVGAGRPRGARGDGGAVRGARGVTWPPSGSRGPGGVLGTGGVVRAGGGSGARVRLDGPRPACRRAA